ncbi:MAG TPA: hypothetical protein VGD68_11720 [Streptosporangiaceae bacterium]
MMAMLVMAASLCLGLSLTVSAASAALAAPATHDAATAPAQGAAGAATTTPTNRSIYFLPSPAARGSGTAGGFIPLITWRECNGLRTTWVDIDMLNLAAGIDTDWCFGYTGTWRFTGNWNVAYFCSGNNKGGFSYYVANIYHSFAFNQGKLLALPLNSVPITLYISGWSGNDTCSS